MEHRIRKHLRQCAKCEQIYTTYRKFDSICLDCLPVNLKIQYFIMRPHYKNLLPLEKKWFRKMQVEIFQYKSEELII